MSRRDLWRVEVLDQTDSVKEARLRVTGGSLRWSRDQAVTGSGTLTVTMPRGVADGIDWRSDRIRITHSDGNTDRTHGIWLPQITGRSVADGLTTATLRLADKVEALNRPVGAWLTYPAGSVVADTVATILTARGAQPVQITPSTATLTKPWTCDPSTTWLSVINALCGTINYAPIRATLDGVLTITPATTLEQSSPAATYGGQPEHLRMRPEWSVDTDLYALPTGVVVYVPRPGGLRGWVGRADLPDTHPLSAAYRGERLVTEQGDTTTAAATQARAELRLAELTEATASIQIQHPIDDTQHLDVVTVDPEGAPGQIVERSITLGVGAVVSSTIRGRSTWTS